MTWTTPTNVTTGTASSSQFNTETVANLQHLRDNRPHAGIGSGSTDASSYVTITHGAGFTPAAVVVSPRSPITGGTIFGSAIVDSVGATTFRIRCFSPTGTGLAAATAVTIQYVCVSNA